MAKKPNITSAEWIVMEILWRENPLTAAEVAEVLPQKQWAANTVRTLLNRLVKKGALTLKPDGNRYLYRVAVRRDKCVQEEVQSLTTRLFGGAASPLLLHFIQNKKLSPDDIAELRQILDGKETK